MVEGSTSRPSAEVTSRRRLRNMDWELFSVMCFLVLWFLECSVSLQTWKKVWILWLSSVSVAHVSVSCRWHPNFVANSSREDVSCAPRRNGICLIEKFQVKRLIEVEVTEMRTLRRRIRISGASGILAPQFLSHQWAVNEKTRFDQRTEAGGGWRTLTFCKSCERFSSCLSCDILSFSFSRPCLMVALCERLRGKIVLQSRI